MEEKEVVRSTCIERLIHRLFFLLETEKQKGRDLGEYKAVYNAVKKFVVVPEEDEQKAGDNK